MVLEGQQKDLRLEHERNIKQNNEYKFLEKQVSQDNGQDSQREKRWKKSYYPT